jgi:hypothetical protein
MKDNLKTHSQNQSQHLDRLEDLVDELVKESPQESRIRTCMKAVGLPYTADPIERMNCVLTALEGARSDGKNNGNRQGPSL